MVDYSKGQIYKIWDNTFTKCYVGSSVQPLSKRMQKHKCDFKKYLSDGCKYMSVFDLFDEFGVENCKIEWVEDVVCKSKKELQAREGFHIRNSDCVNKRIAGRSSKERYEEKRDEYVEKNRQYYVENKDAIVEQRKKHREEHREELNEKGKCHYEKNRDERLEKQKEYYHENKTEINTRRKQKRKDNKEEFKAYRKQYRENNIEKFQEYDKRNYEKRKEQIKEYQKQYRENNKDKISETKTCDCGGNYLKWGHNRHLKSKKHQEYLKSLEQSN